LSNCIQNINHNFDKASNDPILDQKYDIYLYIIDKYDFIIDEYQLL